MNKFQNWMKWICIVFVVFSYLVFLNRAGKFNILYQEKELDSIRHDQDYAYLADTDDSNITIGKLPISLFENDVEIRRDFSDTTQTVREKGSGSFVIWDNGIICFSSTDNSNPFTKKYRIEYPVIIGNRTARYLYAFSFILIWIHLLLHLQIFIKSVRRLAIRIQIERKILIIGFATILPFLIFLFRFSIHQSLWADEIFTLLNYCFDKNPVFPATIYNFPNNHILLNLILSVYFKLAQISSFCQVALSPWIVRIIPIIFSFLSILFTMLAAGKINTFSGILAGVILTTTVPFYSWSTQIRGYSLSFLFMSILIYILVSYQRKPDYHWRLSAAALTAALMIYTIPFNGFFVGALMIATILRAFWDCRKIIQSNLQLKIKLGTIIRHPLINLFFALMFGIFLVFVFYFPVYDQLLDTYLSDGNYSPQTGFNLTVLRSFTELFSSFFYGRFFLFIFLLFGSVLLFLHKKFDKIIYASLFFSFSIIGIPFVLCGILKYTPFNRNFLPLIPVLAFANAILFSEISQNILKTKWISLWLRQLENKTTNSNNEFNSTIPIRTGKIIIGVLLLIVLNLSFGTNIVRIHTALPNKDLARINSLSEPYFLSTELDSDSFLRSLNSLNQQNIPIIIQWPADFYFYHLCDCYEMQCFCDFLGSDAQQIISSGSPYFLIRTVLDGEQDDSLSGKYAEQCKMVQTPGSGAYELYRCNLPSEGTTISDSKYEKVYLL